MADCWEEWNDGTTGGGGLRGKNGERRFYENLFVILFKGGRKGVRII